MHQLIEQFRSRVRDAVAANGQLRIRGGGTKDWYGQQAAGDVLDTRAYSGIVAYEPSELVITARCGTPLAQIDAALAEHGQMLAFEPPHFGAGATLGGALSSALCGPRRATSGAVRDFVLGVRVMNGRGDVLRFGGSVMKNVAGYDATRLLAGSLGTLGLMLEHSVKVLPRPLAESTLHFQLSQAEALAHLNAWAGRPLPISASCWVDGKLSVRLSGAPVALHAAAAALGGQHDGAAASFWRALREQEQDFFMGDAPLWRLSLPSTAPGLLARHPQLIEWGGAQRWLRAGMDDGPEIRSAARAAGGHATLFRGGDKAHGVFEPLAPALAVLHARLKLAFDPFHVFNPARLY